MIWCLLSLHVPDSHPVRDEIVAGDGEAGDVDDHDDADDGIIVHKGWGDHKPNRLVVFPPKEAAKSSHVWENTVAAPI